MVISQDFNQNQRDGLADNTGVSDVVLLTELRASSSGVFSMETHPVDRDPATDELSL